MTRSFRRRGRALPSGLLAVLLLVAPGATAARAQEAPAAQDETAAVKSLLEAAAVRRRSAEVFSEMLGRYQRNWPGAVIEGYRAKGLFRGLTPAATARMEALVREFSERVFGGIRERVTGQLITDESMLGLSGPPLGKHFDAGELTRLAEFARTPAGQKLVDLTSKELTGAVVSVLEEKGFFRVSPSPEEDEARLDGIIRELRGGGLFAEVQGRLEARARSTAAAFTPEELSALAAFAQTPLGLKVAEVWAPVTAEILQRNAALYAPRAGEIAGEVFAEQMEFFQEGVAEIMRPASQRARPRRPRRK